MKNLIVCLCLLVLPLSLLIADPDPVASEREVFVYLYNAHGDWEEYPFSFGTDSDEMKRVLVQEDQHLYRLNVSLDEDHIRLAIGEKTMDWGLPEGNESLFIGIPNLELFPYGVDVSTKADLLARNPLEFRIEGKMPLVEFSEVTLLMPFLAWPQENNVMSTQLVPTNDWRTMRFAFEGVLANRSLVFVQIGDRYFPVLITEDHGYTAHLEFDETSGKIQIQSEEDDISQTFLNERYQQEGMTEAEYADFVATFRDSELRAPLIRQLNLEVLDSRWEDTNRADEFDQLFRVLHLLGSDATEQAFAHAYQERIDQETSWLHHRLHEWEEVPATGFVFSLLLFAIAIVIRIVRPRSSLNRFFLGIELFTHTCAWFILIEDTLVSMEETVYFLHIGSLPLVFSAMAAFYIMVFLLIPDMLARRGGWGRQISHLGLLVLGVVAVGFFQVINPLVDYSIVWTYDTWTFMEFSGDRHFLQYRLDDLNIAVVIFSIIYGAGRHVITRRLTQLETKSSALGAELNALKTQISPHFFFNSLNTVYSFSLSENSPKTAEAITKLSDLMRFVIYQGNQEFISLDKELDYLADYIDLQELRLDPAQHQVKFEIEGDPTGLEIAPLLLISLIENAFKHGISMSQPCFVDIRIYIEGDLLELSVENAIHGEKVIAGSTHEKEGGLGLVNTRQRLDLLYPGRYQWDTDVEEDRYLTRLSVVLN